MRMHRHQRDSIPRSAMRALRYPGEQRRFVLAAVMSTLWLIIVVLSIIGAGRNGSGLVELVGGVFGALVVLWFTIHLLRARLLGSAVRVTRGTFPEIQTMLEEVCAQLHYAKGIDIYVADKSDPPVKLTTYLGTHIIIIEGGLASELLEPDKQPQLRFLLARHVGALKTKQFRLDPIVVMLNAANAMQFIKPFLLPYERTVTLTGDQVGLVACRSVPAALAATERLMVGGELTGALSIGAVLPQAAMVKRQLLPRLAQLISPTPHTINRYFNLLAFARRLDVNTWTAVCAQLGPDEVAQLEALWQRSPHRRRAQSRHADSPAQWWPGAGVPPAPSAAPAPSAPPTPSAPPAPSASPAPSAPPARSAPPADAPVMQPPALDFPPPEVSAGPAPGVAAARRRRWAGRITPHRRRVS